jgi:hypothetical protein
MYIHLHKIYTYAHRYIDIYIHTHTHTLGALLQKTIWNMFMGMYVMYAYAQTLTHTQIYSKFP